MARELTFEQIKAIKLVKKLGERLAREHPEIIGEWERGDIMETIAQRYLPSNLTKGVLRTSVGYALRQLLERQRRIEIGREHIADAARRRDLEYALRGEGIYKLTRDEKVAICTRSNITQGIAPYSNVRMTEFGEMSERGYILRLRTAKVALREIASRTNLIYGNSRTPTKIEGYIKFLKRNGESIPKINNVERLGRIFKTRGIFRFSDETKSTEFGEISEMGYIDRLKREGTRWKEIVERVNTIFEHKRTLGGLWQAYFLYKNKRK